MNNAFNEELNLEEFKAPTQFLVRSCGFKVAADGLLSSQIENKIGTRSAELPITVILKADILARSASSDTTMALLCEAKPNTSYQICSGME